MDERNVVLEREMKRWSSLDGKVAPGVKSQGYRPERPRLRAPYAVVTAFETAPSRGQLGCSPMLKLPKATADPSASRQDDSALKLTDARRFGSLVCGHLLVSMTNFRFGNSQNPKEDELRKVWRAIA
jgi:hypothetical protein